MLKHSYRYLSLAVAAAVLSACNSMEPQPYSADDQQKRILEDQAKMYEGQQAVTHPISFYEAVARALKYNLDYRLKLMESALAADLRDVSSHEMLPRLVASAGYAGRNNDSGGTSIGIEDREESLRASTSEERYRTIDSLGLSWSLLDFGMAYYRTQQKTDQVLMAEERRRKVAQNVLQDVRNAYWRALGAQRLLPEVNGLLERTQNALAAARSAESKGLLPRQEALAYQRALLDSIDLLSIRRQDLEFAQAELAALISLPPGSTLKLAEQTEPEMPGLNVNISQLEEKALQNRPEINEEWYRKRVNENDLKIAKAQLWPNVGVNWSYQYDSNDYLYNNSWSQTGIQVSMNLMRLLQLPALNSAEESQTKTDDMRRLALSMAVLTQVRVGALRYQLSHEQLDFAQQSLQVDERLLQYARAAKTSTVGSELEVSRAEGRYLLSRYQREAAYSHTQAAWGRLYNSVGLDMMPETIKDYDVKTLASEIERTLKQQEQVNLLAAQQGSVNVPQKP